ncbi:hypothetical protein HGRIS_009991 [Hohenbuehelia grisea]|uniref:Yos1-like protein n=1 Tax=Hohenbuehelia grisea TaxID=104357 RepID=A0ABR3J350_9AGAR
MGIGTILYVALLLINSMAVLSEDRFLARIGWSSSQATNAAAFQQTYDQSGYGSAQPEVGIKVRIIDLLTAVRTLMRIPLIVFNILVIAYELPFGR